VSEIEAFVAFLAKERNDSPHTVKAYGRDLAEFAAFCTGFYGGPWSWAGVDRLAIRGFLGALQQRGLAKRSIARALSALRTFYRFLNLTSGVEVNPAKAARTPKLEKTLPTHLDRSEIELLFAEAERRAAAGGFREARDLAMLELFYSTGMRLSELTGLNDQDLDLVSDQVKVRGIELGVPLPVQTHDARDLRDWGPARRGLPPPPIPQPVITDPLVAQAPAPQRAGPPPQDLLGLQPGELAADRLHQHLLDFHRALHDSRGIGHDGPPRSTMALPLLSAGAVNSRATHGGQIMCWQHTSARGP